MRSRIAQWALVIALVFCGAPLPAQQSASTTDTGTIQAPQHSAEDPDGAELIAYRFRLGADESSYALLATNRDKVARTFQLRQLSPATESRPDSGRPLTIEPGGTLEIKHTDIRWKDFDCVLVQASRGVELRLSRAGEPDGPAIRISPRHRLYDVVADTRLAEMPAADVDQSVELLGGGARVVEMVKAHEDAHGAAARVTRDVKPGRSRILLVTPHVAN